MALICCSVSRICALEPSRKTCSVSSSSRAHGASPHYKADAQSNAPIEHGQLYLVDSGGQWRDGTTDITRVLPIGEPTGEMRDRFTRVLKGHIALATARFPHGASGNKVVELAFGQPQIGRCLVGRQ